MEQFYSPYECIDHPLGILCRCKEYREIAAKFVVHTIGTLERKSLFNFNEREWPDPWTTWMKHKAETDAILLADSEKKDGTAEDESDDEEEEEDKGKKVSPSPAPKRGKTAINVKSNKGTNGYGAVE